MKMPNNKSIAVSVLAALMLTGCGDPGNRNADPLKDFPELRKDVAPQKYKPADQSFDGVLFDIQAEGREGYRQLDFYEGREVSYRLLARTFVPGGVFSLKASNLPAGASLIPINEPNANYILKWKPEIGTIPGSASTKSVDINLEFVMLSGSTGQAREIFARDNRNRISTFTLNVHFADVQPVLKIKGLTKDQYKFGDVIPIAIEVTDPNSSKDRQPEIQKVFDRANQTNEAKAFDLGPALYEDPKKTPQYLGQGRWVFSYLLDTTNVKQEFLGSKSGYDAGEIVIYAFNRSTRLDSIRQVIRIKISEDESATASVPPAKRPAAPPVKKAKE